MLKRGKKDQASPSSEEAVYDKVLDVDASMQGTLTFRDPVNLRINGSFEGTLDTLGSLVIGEKASVKAKIKGEIVIIAGEVVGDVDASEELEVHSTGRLIGDVQTPSVVMEKGAVLQGQLDMIGSQSKASSRIKDKENYMDADELASYLSVEKSLIQEWVANGKLPGIKDGSSWKFDKSKVDEWVASGRIK